MHKTVNTVVNNRVKCHKNRSRNHARFQFIYNYELVSLKIIDICLYKKYVYINLYKNVNVKIYINL